MKTVKLLAVLLVAGTISAFAQKSEVNVNQSTVRWTGKKIGGSHTGEIQIKNASFEIKNDEIISGQIVMDMKTITNTDLEDPSYNQKLVGHLKSDDFFGVEKFPTSIFEVGNSSKFINGKVTVSGTISIKGKTENITFELLKSNNTFTTQLKIDRSLFDVRYGSNSFFDNLGDKAIDDIFVLDIKMVLK